MAMCSSTTSTADQRDGTSITDVQCDIITTHILTRLDGTTLASTACTSSMLRTLCTEEKLWRDLCTSMWISINDPRIRHVISTFPTGYRSFFSDSFPTTFHPHTMKRDQISSSPTSGLISAVDIRHKNKIVCSKVEVTETVSKDFLAPQLCIDLLGPKERVKFEADNEESMRLSWILIDPARKRSINLSSQSPVSVERYSVPEEVHLTYVTVFPGSSRVGSMGPVQCRIMVTCEGEEGGEMHLRVVNMQVQDMNGINLSGQDSLIIFQEAMGCERRKPEKGREVYEEFMEMKRKRREIKLMREKRLDMVCTILRLFIFVTLLYGLLILPQVTFALPHEFFLLASS